MKVVSDTGPLIHLSEIGCPNLFSVFHLIHVPEAIQLEFNKHMSAHHFDITSFDNAKIHKLPQKEVSQFIEKNALTHLHFGERECLYLCNKIHATTILTDDLAVRDAAKKLGFTPVGSLGIIVRSYRNNDISLTDATNYIRNLYDVSSLFVTKTLADLAIEQLQQYHDSMGN